MGELATGKLPVVRCPWLSDSRRPTSRQIERPQRGARCGRSKDRSQRILLVVAAAMAATTTTTAVLLGGAVTAAAAAVLLATARAAARALHIAGAAVAAARLVRGAAAVAAARGVRVTRALFRMLGSGRTGRTTLAAMLDGRRLALARRR